MAIVAETCSPSTVPRLLMSEGKACAPALCLAQNTEMLVASVAETCSFFTLLLACE